jgi:large subunit ribosomal protein L20
MRVTKGTVTLRKHKKVLKQAKGFRGSLGTLFRATKEAVTKSMKYATRDRKNKKRDFRALWIIRVHAAANQCGMPYNKLINGLKKANILINRKMLAEIAISDEQAFAKIAEKAKG